MRNRAIAVISALVLGGVGTFASSAYAWDHPGHMTTADVAYSEIERALRI
jgi:hypothetical protein